MSSDNDRSGRGGPAHGCRRRPGDEGLALLLAADLRSGPVEPEATLVAFEPNVLAQVLFTHPLAHATLLFALPADDVLVLPAAEARLLPCDEGDDHLRQRVSAAAAASRRERYRLERRVLMPDWLMLYVDELQAASTLDEICTALIACAPQVVGAFTALVCTSDGAGGDAPLRTIRDPRLGVTPPPVLRAVASMYPGPAIVSEVESRRGAGGPHTALASIFRAFAAAQLVWIPVMEGVWLILVERRSDRLFTAEDRDVLQWVTGQARRSILALSAQA